MHGEVGQPVGPRHKRSEGERARVGMAGVQAGRCRSSTRIDRALARIPSESLSLAGPMATVSNRWLAEKLTRRSPVILSVVPTLPPLRHLPALELGSGKLELFQMSLPK
ncbi:hypothetical protein OG21DRAFT_894794 [Imleria badia]|nr:hypothetical protein OG21DRAFT_894794 [Imleria badia]